MICRRSDNIRSSPCKPISEESVVDETCSCLPTRMFAMSSRMLKKHAQGCICSAIKSARHCCSSPLPSWLLSVPKMTTSPASSLAILRNWFANCRAADTLGAANMIFTVLDKALRHCHASASNSCVLPPPNMLRMTGNTLLKFVKMSVCLLENPFVRPRAAAAP